MNGPIMFNLVASLRLLTPDQAWAAAVKMAQLALEVGSAQPSETARRLLTVAVFKHGPGENTLTGTQLCSEAALMADLKVAEAETPRSKNYWEKVAETLRTRSIYLSPVSPSNERSALNMAIRDCWSARTSSSDDAASGAWCSRETEMGEYHRARQDLPSEIVKHLEEFLAAPVQGGGE